MKSKLDPKVYGPPESAITREIIEPQIINYNTLKEVPKAPIMIFIKLTM